MVFDMVFDFSLSTKNYHDAMVRWYSIFINDLMHMSPNRRWASPWIGCMFFSNIIRKSWDGFLAADIAYPQIHMLPDYKSCCIGDGSPLFQTMVESMRRTNYFCKSISNRENVGTEPRIIFLTDGRRNRDPLDHEEVCHVIADIYPHRIEDALIMGYIHTESGLSFDEFKQTASAIGIPTSNCIDFSTIRMLGLNHIDWKNREFNGMKIALYEFFGIYDKPLVLE